MKIESEKLFKKSRITLFFMQFPADHWLYRLEAEIQKIEPKTQL